MDICKERESSNQLLAGRLNIIFPFVLCSLAVAFSSELHAAKSSEKPVAEPTHTAQTSDSPATSPPPGKAMVYVFRKRQFYGAGEQARVFVNDSLIGILHLANYSQIEVPQGTTVVVATMPNGEGGPKINDLRPPNMSGAWTLLPGCSSIAALGWKQFAAAANDDLLACENEIGKLARTCGPYTPTTRPDTSTATMEDLNLTVTFGDWRQWHISNGQAGHYFQGASLDGTFVLILPSGFPRISDPEHGGSSWVVEVPGKGSLPPFNVPTYWNVPTCNFKLTELGDAPTLFSEANALKDFHAKTVGTQGATIISSMKRTSIFEARLQFQAEPGKTYYVNYSLGSGLALVEPKEGEKEVKHANPVKTW